MDKGQKSSEKDEAKKQSGKGDVQNPAAKQSDSETQGDQGEETEETSEDEGAEESEEDED